MSSNISSETLVETLLAFALAIGGGAFGVTLGRSHRTLCALISVGAGTLLGVTVFGILPETLESQPWWTVALAFASGYALFYLITKHLFHVCPACAAGHFNDATMQRFSKIATAMMLALAIHCTVDGLAISVGHEDHDFHGSGTGHVGLAIVLAICVHKVPEGLALGSILIGAGFSRSATLYRVAAVESTTLLGGVIGAIFLPHVSEFWLALALANAAGGFFYLAAHALIGELARSHKRLVIPNFAAGFLFIGAIAWLLKLLL